DPHDARALTARALDLSRGGQLEAARATLRAALERGDDPVVYVARGEVSLAAGDAAAATADAWAALRLAPRDSQARALLKRARELELELRGETGDGGADDDDGGEPLYRLGRELQRLALARPELAELAGDATQAV